MSRWQLWHHLVTSHHQMQDSMNCQVYLIFHELIPHFDLFNTLTAKSANNYKNELGKKKKTVTNKPESTSVRLTVSKTNYTDFQG